jgi:hypothetical protein
MSPPYHGASSWPIRLGQLAMSATTIAASLRFSRCTGEYSSADEGGNLTVCLELEGRGLAMGRHPAPMPGMTAVRRSPAGRAAYLGFPAVRRLHPQQQTLTARRLNGST